LGTKFKSKKCPDSRYFCGKFSSVWFSIYISAEYPEHFVASAIESFGIGVHFEIPNTKFFGIEKREHRLCLGNKDAFLALFLNSQGFYQ